MSQFAGFHREIPIEAGTGSASCSRDIGIQEPRIGGFPVVRQLQQDFGPLNAEGLDHPHLSPKQQPHLRGFISVKLNRVEPRLGDSGPDECGVGVDEESNATHEWRQVPRDGGSPLRLNEPGRAGNEDKPQRIGASVDRSPRIFFSGDTANLDA